MKRIGQVLICGMLLQAGLLAGCGDTPAKPTTAPVAVASPGGAPTYGTPSGMGFSTGDAINNGGSGSGLMGYHGTGAMGTSNAITDKHTALAPTFPTTAPVLPPQ